MLLDDLIRAIWKWWLWLRRTKKYRSWSRFSATVSTCSVIDDTFGERLQLTFKYEINGEQFRGLILSKTRPAGTTLRLEDDVLEGHTLSIRANPADPASSGVLNEDNPKWPWQIEE